MVKKLVKYDFIGFSRVMLPTSLVLIGLALLNRFIQIFETDSVAYNITFVSSCIVFCVAIIVSLVLTVILSITRFYKNLFSSEGYLSFTLPVTVGQHIISKVIVSMLFIIINILSIIVSLCIATSGEVLIEIIKAIGYALKRLFMDYSYNVPLFILEALLMVLASIAASLLLYYVCICVGQLARKNRVLCAVGVYFAYYFVTQLIGTVAIIIMVVFEEYLPLEAIATFIGDHTIAFLHIASSVYIVLSLLMAFVYFVISKAILKNRLNLE